MWRRFFFILAFCNPGFSFGQQAAKEERARLLTRFHFEQVSGGVILLHAKLDTISTPLNFILDTGSGAASLDSATAAEFHIPHVPSGKVVSGVAGMRPVDFSQNNRLTFPGLTIDSLDLYINDYEVLSSVYGEKIDGILGYSVLSRYIIGLNYDSLYISFYTPGKMKYPPEGYTLHPIFTALPIQALTVQDRRKIDANFYLDTGAGLCFLISKKFEDDSSFLKKRRRPVSIQVEGMGGRKHMLVTLIRSLQIGPYHFNRVPTNVLDDVYNVTSYPFLGGLIGNDLLRRFNVILNYPNREVHIKPNGHFEDPFDYSYTGLSMYYADGKIYADDVVSKSPAYRGGVRKGDVIIAVNTNFSNDINVYKTLMQSVGQRVTLLVSRKGTPLILSFRVGHIY
ncbi:MAG: aspartyl protease family protein [Bacteroidota bacterium]|nr:aspartyl protease family protein [Bacteroidota bacterium]